MDVQIALLNRSEANHLIMTILTDFMLHTFCVAFIFIDNEDNVLQGANASLFDLPKY